MLEKAAHLHIRIFSYLHSCTAHWRFEKVCAKPRIFFVAKQNMDTSLLIQIAMGIALSACAGFRVFIPMLAGALAGHFHVIPLPADMAWLSSWPAIAVFGTAAIA